MFAVLDDGSLVEVLAPSEIDALGGSVAGLHLALRVSLPDMDWRCARTDQQTRALLPMPGLLS